MSEHITIGTEDLAYSLDNVTSSVSQTTAAVAELGESVCAAEREAADEVCRSVNRGFFTLIRTQLTQKKVQVQSVAESQLLTLRHFAQSLRRIKEQMGVDFERITQRYTKLFKTLSDSLKNRVYALDRPVAEVVDGEYGAMDRRVLTAGASSAVLQQDVVPAMTELEAVRCKRDCCKVIDGVKTLIDHGIRLSEAMDGIIRDVRQDEMRSLYLPVLMVEYADIFLAEGMQTECVLSEGKLEPALVARVRRAFIESTGKMSWKADVGRRDEVTSRVRSLISREGCSAREAKLISDMIGRADWQELEAVG